MARRSMLPMPSRSVRHVASTVQSVVEPPPPPSPCPGPSRPCPGPSRMPRASGLRPPRSYASPAPCSPSPPPASPSVRRQLFPPTSGLRPPQVRSGLRPPQAGLRPPRAVCPGPPPAPRSPCPAQRSPSPQRLRSPSPPCASPSPPCAPPPPPCPAASPPCLENMTPREMLLATQGDEEEVVRAALQAQWQASLAAFPDTPADQLRRVAERRAKMKEQQWEERVCRQEEEAERRRSEERGRRIQQMRDEEEKREEYNLTLEAVEEMLMEERDMMLRAQTERLLQRARQQVTSEAEWHAALGIVDLWRRNMLEAYLPYAKAEARLAADRELISRRRSKYKRQMIPGPQMSPLEESQVDVFDDSPPCSLPPPVLPERVFDRPSFLDDSPPSGLQPPLLQRSMTPNRSSADWYSEFEDLGDPRRILTFDSEDDSEMLEGAVGGSWI